MLLLFLLIEDVVMKKVKSTGEIPKKIENCQNHDNVIKLDQFRSFKSKRISNCQNQLNKAPGSKDYRRINKISGSNLSFSFCDAIKSKESSYSNSNSPKAYFNLDSDDKAPKKAKLRLVTDHDKCQDDKDDLGLNQDQPDSYFSCLSSKVSRVKNSSENLRSIPLYVSNLQQDNDNGDIVSRMAEIDSQIKELDDLIYLLNKDVYDQNDYIR